MSVDSIKNQSLMVGEGAKTCRAERSLWDAVNVQNLSGLAWFSVSVLLCSSGSPGTLST